MKKILIIGTNEPIVKTIARLIEKNGQFIAETATNITEALQTCEQHALCLILIGAGINEADEQQFMQFLKTDYPNIPVIRHYGGGSGLLYAEIHQALGTLPQP
ncbi:response regulator [Pedobacter montanisoli]|uniref:Response regulator n=1 Tax=Pedobacter montanisoli TaxID=2923277 RepID=A0ABS9ZS69_9SPHI|nr:response regulator [Pedobacter montanisoli]MCJ0741415.1 response regulator [Pedobacter montanisoli]